MKKLITLFAIVFIAFSCKNEEKKQVTETKEDTPKYLAFGDKIDDKNALSAKDLMTKFKTLKVGDTINTKVNSKIVDVCSKKGCWMVLELENGETVRVKFKDYGFFVPLDASGEAIVNGKAFVSETSVEELKHYAEDGGKSKEEIDAITEPKRTYGFLADGVLLKS